MSTDTEPMAYIGRDSDGMVQVACVDTRDEITADCVASMIRDGLTVERVSCAWARKFFLTDTPYPYEQSWRATAALISA